MFDVVEWIMINQTGTVQSLFSDRSNVSATITFKNASDNFTSYMRCSSNSGYSIKEVYIIKGTTYSTVPVMHIIQYVFNVKVKHIVLTVYVLTVFDFHEIF